jgi:hypothetical protein
MSYDLIKHLLSSPTFNIWNSWSIIPKPCAGISAFTDTESLEMYIVLNAKKLCHIGENFSL